MYAHLAAETGTVRRTPNRARDRGCLHRQANERQAGQRSVGRAGCAEAVLSVGGGWAASALAGWLVGCLADSPPGRPGLAPSTHPRLDMNHAQRFADVLLPSYIGRKGL